MVSAFVKHIKKTKEHFVLLVFYSSKKRKEVLYYATVIGRTHTNMSFCQRQEKRKQREFVKHYRLYAGEIKRNKHREYTLKEALLFYLHNFRQLCLVFF